jgi:hypothetical protein
MQFQKGQSGNPAGRQPGSRNRRTILAEQLFDERAQGALEKFFGLVDDGDPAMLKLCTDRILPRLRDRPVTFQLPPMEKAADTVAAVAAITKGLAEGELSAREAADLSTAVKNFAFAFDLHTIDEQLTRLEKNAEEIQAQGTIEPRGKT